MEAILIISVFVVSVLVLRLLGAWMLRINDVINLQREILQELKNISHKQ